MIARSARARGSSGLTPSARTNPQSYAGQLDLLPGEARLVMPQDEEGLSAQIGNWSYDHVDEPVLIGPTARPVALRWRGAPPRLVPVSAQEWAREAITPAAVYANRIARPSQAFARAALRRLGLATDGAGPVSRRALREEDAPLADALAALIDAGEVTSAAELAEQIGAAPHRLRRVALAAFGFPVKTLLTRHRFLRALEAYRGSGLLTDAVAHGYHDKSHFFRDAQRFLGTTPKRFLEA